MKATPLTLIETLQRHYVQFSLLPDGPLYQEQEGNQVVAVTKRDGELLLSILPAADPRSYFVQTAVKLNAPCSLPFAYMQAVLVGLAWTAPPRRIGILGLGGGALPLALRHYFPEAILEVVEISPAVCRIARRFFGLPLDDYLHLHNMDARDYLAQHTAGFDLLLIDTYGDKGHIPYHLATVEFYRLCRDCLTTGGVTVINIATATPFYFARRQSIQAVFPTPYIIPADANYLFFGSRGEMPDKGWIMRRCQEMEQAQGLPFSVSGWAEKMVRMGEETINLLAGDELAPLHDGAPPAGYTEGFDAS